MFVLGLAYFSVLLGVAAASDLRRYRIPNWVCAAIAVGAFVLALPPDAHAWASRAASFALVAVVVLGLYLARALGGGDVKLLAAIALWIPLGDLALFALALGLAGGLQGLLTLIVRRLGAREGRRRMRMPYAVSIALAGWTWAALAMVRAP